MIKAIKSAVIFINDLIATAIKFKHFPDYVLAITLALQIVHSSSKVHITATLMDKIKDNFSVVPFVVKIGLAMKSFAHKTMFK